MSWDFVFGWVTAVILARGIRSWFRTKRAERERGEW